jgi:hypothetical protein
MIMTCIGAKNVANFTTLEPNKNVVGFFENKPARQANWIYIIALWIKCVCVYIYIYIALWIKSTIYLYIYHFESSVQKNKKAVVMAIVYQIMCRHVKNSLPPCWMIWKK